MTRKGLASLIALVMLVGAAQADFACIQRCNNYYEGCWNDLSCRPKLESLIQCNKDVCATDLGTFDGEADPQWGTDLDTYTFAQCSASPCCFPAAPVPAMLWSWTMCVRQTCWIELQVDGIQRPALFELDGETDMCTYTNGTAIANGGGLGSGTTVPPVVDGESHCGCVVGSNDGETIIVVIPPLVSGNNGEGEAVIVVGEGESYPCGCQGEGEDIIVIVPPVIGSGNGEGEGEGADYLCGVGCLPTAFKCMDSAPCVVQLAEMIGCTFLNCGIQVSFSNAGKTYGAENCFGTYDECFEFGADIKMVTLSDIPKMANCFATQCFPSGAHPYLYDFVQCLNNDCAGGNLTFNSGAFMTLSIATFVGLLFLIVL